MKTNQKTNFPGGFFLIVVAAIINIFLRASGKAYLETSGIVILVVTIIFVLIRLILKPKERKENPT